MSRSRSHPSVQLEWCTLACFLCAGVQILPVLWFLIWFVYSRLDPTLEQQAIPVSRMLAVVAVFLVPVCAFVALGLAMRFHVGRPRGAEAGRRTGPAPDRPGATGGATPP